MMQTEIAYPELDTPCLVIDLDVMERNIAEMAAVAEACGVRLRPHTKSHKSPEIAEMQVAAGSSGITCAKLGEAFVMADAGIDDILVAYPIVGETKLRRLRELVERAHVRTSLDSAEVARGVGRIGTELGRAMPILVEVDTGLHRMGRPPGAPSAELVAEISRVRGVEVIGLLAHAGHAYDARTPSDLDACAKREVADLLETAELCRRAGLEIREISVGATPTARAEASLGGVTELRPGTYVFNDVQMMRAGVATEDTCAARVLATVVARPTGDRFVVDAGSKSLTSDGASDGPFPGRGVVRGRPGLFLDFLTEEHGVGHVENGATVDIGDRLEIIPLHICPCVNMFDSASGVRRGAVEREIAIAGRGRMR